MRRFTFSLDRVLQWRSTQARLEESLLEALHAELRELNAGRTRLESEAGAAAAVVFQSGGASGAELATLGAFRQACALRLARLDQVREQSTARIARQTEAALERRRAVRLLERLKERRLEEWKRTADRELELEAAEAWLARGGQRSAPPLAGR